MARPRQLLSVGSPKASAYTAEGSRALSGAFPETAWRALLHWRSWAAPAAIVVLAAVLRLWGIRHDAQNPFYDAAVHSMDLSWHNFFFGALDPSGALAIDKPPVDLWLQVTSTKLLGFNRTALALPEALGGIAAVALLYAAVARACGRMAGTIAALVLAVLPIAVLTARSDTMDSVMCALLVAALWCSVEAVRARRARYVLLSAALVGIAFNVKLTQALVPIPALALMWWAGSRPGRRIALGAAAAAVFAFVAMAWAIVASLTPLSARPYPIGSHTGSIFKAIFVFNGIERLTGASHEVVPYGATSPAGFGRLFGSGQPHYATLIGWELAAALVLLIAAGVLWWRARDPGGALLTPGEREPSTEAPGAREPGTTEPGATAPLQRAGRWLAVALVVWILTAYLLFSFSGHMQPRYLEAMSPAVAGALGIAAAYLLGRLAKRPRLRQAAIVLAGLALLAGPVRASVQEIEARAGDANPSGTGNQYSAYLRAHRHGARYEVAASNPLAVVGLISQDGQPVLILRTIDGEMVSVEQLRRLVSQRAVRYVLISSPCTKGKHCASTIAWSVRNSVQVRPGLYRYFPPSQLR
ncbi:MAG TPA: glycosyltransferase family 39 protein [Solirubrobacteraceae bacterium]|jgi:4-amino-4-deoxy-L-arabinose transferase-like glycosyltransferase|nr:glycosyltransferase family 39 protein [Solirubrobacteraceae bacterium]